MKSLILMNPVRRRRSRRHKLAGAALKSHNRRLGRRSRRTTARRSVRRTRVRRNPVTRSRTHSPAMRAKISRAVKAANRRRGSRPIRSRITAVARRARHSFRTFRARRSFRRSGGGGGGSLSVKSLFSRSIVMTASGAISASFLTSWLLRTYGSKLPMANTMWGRIGYKLAIPFAGAYAVKKFAKQHDVANGMLIGGVVMAVNDLIASFNQPKVAAGTVAGVGGPADYASAMIPGMDSSNLLNDYSRADGEFYDEDPDGLGEYFDAPVDPLYSNTPAFDSSFA